MAKWEKQAGEIGKLVPCPQKTSMNALTGTFGMSIIRRSPWVI